jgi:methionyl aminopeptidase
MVKGPPAAGLRAEKETHAMTIETDADLAGLQRIGRIVADCLQMMGKSIEVGMTTAELDTFGETFLASHGAKPAPRLTYGFPGATCISVNHEIAHGLPGARRIKAGDVINIDVSAELGGYFADTGGSFLAPEASKQKRFVCDVTKKALTAAMREARAERPLNVIGRAIEQTAARHRLSVIRNLGSHGVGRALHEEPSFIPPYFDPRDKRRLRAGQVITIEPFLSTGAETVEEAEDGWTLYTAPRYVSAQYEHTLVITRGQPMIMTLPTPA